MRVRRNSAVRGALRTQLGMMLVAGEDSPTRDLTFVGPTMQTMDTAWIEWCQGGTELPTQEPSVDLLPKVMLTIWRNSWHLAQRGEKYPTFWHDWRRMDSSILNASFRLNAIDLDQPLLITTEMLLWVFKRTATGAGELLQRPNARVSANIYHEMWALGTAPQVIVQFARLAAANLPPLTIGANDLSQLQDYQWFAFRDTMIALGIEIPFAAFGNPANIATGLLSKLLQEKAYYNTIMAHPAITISKKRTALNSASRAPSTV